MLRSRQFDVNRRSEDQRTSEETTMTKQYRIEVLATGYGLIEGPRVDSGDNLFFSDVLGGGVYRRAPNGDITIIIPKRRGVGGIALHADGGVIVSGRNICHVKDGTTRSLFRIEGLRVAICGDVAECSPIDEQGSRPGTRRRERRCDARRPPADDRHVVGEQRTHSGASASIRSRRSEDRNSASSSSLATPRWCT